MGYFKTFSDLML